MVECFCENCRPISNGLDAAEEAMCEALLDRAWRYKYLARFYYKQGYPHRAIEMHERMEDCCQMTEAIEHGHLRGRTIH